MKWRYLTTCLSSDSLPGLEAELNEFGQRGWDLVCLALMGRDYSPEPGRADLYLCVFKRQLPPPDVEK